MNLKPLIGGISQGMMIDLDDPYNVPEGYYWDDLTESYIFDSERAINGADAEDALARIENVESERDDWEESCMTASGERDTYKDRLKAIYLELGASDFHECMERIKKLVRS